MHLVMTQPAKFRAGNLVFANLGRLEVHVNVQARHRILLESQVRHKETVDHVDRSQAHIDLAIDRQIHRSGHDVIFRAGSDVSRPTAASPPAEGSISFGLVAPYFPSGPG